MVVWWRPRGGRCGCLSLARPNVRRFGNNVGKLSEVSLICCLCTHPGKAGGARRTSAVACIPTRTLCCKHSQPSRRAAAPSRAGYSHRRHTKSGPRGSRPRAGGPGPGPMGRIVVAKWVGGRAGRLGEKRVVEWGIGVLLSRPFVLGLRVIHPSHRPTLRADLSVGLSMSTVSSVAFAQG